MNQTEERPGSEKAFNRMVAGFLVLCFVWLCFSLLPLFLPRLLGNTPDPDHFSCRHLYEFIGGYLLLTVLLPLGDLVILAALSLRVSAHLNRFLTRTMPNSIASRLLHIPILHNIIVLFYVRERRAAWIMSAAALLAWILWLTGGLLCNLPAMILMFAASLIGIYLPMKLKKSHLVCGTILLVLTGISWAAAGVVNFKWDRALARNEAEWRELGIPRNREELKEYLYRDAAPDAAYTAKANRYNREDRPSFSSAGYAEYLLSPEIRREVETYFDDPRIHDECEIMDSFCKRDKILKYEQEVPLFLNHAEFPQLNMQRFAALLYSWRIIRACEKQDRAEALQLFQLQTNALKTVYCEDYAIGSLIAFLCDRDRVESISYLLGAGILADADLRQLASQNAGIEKQLQDTAIHGFRSEALMQRDALEFFLLTPANLFKSDFFSNELGRWPLRKSLHGPLSSPTTLWGGWLFRRELLTIRQYCTDFLRLLNRRADYFEIRSEFEALDKQINRFYRNGSIGISRYFRSDYLRLAQQLARATAQVRMCDLALEIEQYRRASEGAYPAALPPTVDPVDGKPFTLTHGTIELWERGKEEPLTFTGYQLSGTGGNAWSSPEWQSPTRREYFNVIFTPISPSGD